MLDNRSAISDPPTDDRSSLVGTLIAGKYRVDRVLGSGGMGVVVQATHVALNQCVAIKLIRDDVARSPELIARFMREARAAAQLPPEHIARVTDVGQTEVGEPFLVMELLAGRDLDAELEARGPLPIEEAVSYILQACEGVAEAHAAGLVHRDLKPANLFIDTRRVAGPVIKVLDFGLSKSYDPKSDKLTQTSSSFGTPGYMAPEQIRSAKYAEPRSDQHALAMILFELLTGEMAYSAKNITALLISICTTPPPHARALRLDVPKGLDAAILRALAKRPEDRFADLAGFAAAIAPFGGPTGPAIAQRIARILDPQRLSAFAPRPSSQDYPRISEPDTNVPTTSDPGDVSTFRRKSPLLAAAIVGVAALAITGIFVFRAGSGPEVAAPPESPAVTADSRPATSPADGAPAAQVMPVEPAPTPLPASQPAATAPAVKPTARTPTGAKAPPVVRSTPKPATKPAPAGPQKSARDVFGGDR
jgi:serine/threonine-protein kinase